jgi:hypothetical protein
MFYNGLVLYYYYYYLTNKLQMFSSLAVLPCIMKTYFFKWILFQVRFCLLLQLVNKVRIYIRKIARKHRIPVFSSISRKMSKTENLLGKKIHQSKSNKLFEIYKLQVLDLWKRTWKQKTWLVNTPLHLASSSKKLHRRYYRLYWLMITWRRAIFFSLDFSCRII